MKLGYGILVARIAMIVLLGLAVPKVVSAQTGTGSIHGQVNDASGGAVPNVSVTVTGPTGRTYMTTTGRDGAFDVKDLAPGKYKVAITAANFAPYENDAVAINSDQVQRLNIALAIQAQQQQVTVSGEAPVLDVTPSENASSVVISGKELEALPDDPDELQSDLEALAGPSPGPNGGQMYIDGFTAGQLPPKSAIREIRLNQNPFSAEYDKVGFGRIEIFTKPGTDKWHGQASINGNDAAFNSKNPFARSEPGYDSLQFNGNLGGPLNKNASIFLNADYRNIHDESIVSAITGINSSGDGIPFNASISTPKTRINIGPRLDYQLGKNNTLSVRYQYYRDDQNNDGIGAFSLPSSGYDLLTTEQTVQLDDTQVFGAKIINETRFQYLRDEQDEAPVSALPSISVPGSFLGGGSNAGSIIDNANHYELQNYTSISFAKHFVKFGARLREVTDLSYSASGFNGSFLFPNLTAYENSQPNQFLLTTGIPTANVSMFDAGIYAEDDWRIRPNITFSYGLRFETQTDISDHADFAPRLGLAWGLGRGKGNPKTVLRAGYGIFYDRFAEDQILQAQRLNGITEQQYIVTNPGFYCPNTLSVQTCPQIGTIMNDPRAIPTIYRIAPNLHAPYISQIAISVERQVTKIANLSVSYLNSLGYDQLLTNNINTPLPGNYNPSAPESGRPYGAGNIFQYQSDGIYKQNQMILNVNVRAGARLTLNGYYTLNYADSDTAGPTSFPSNPYNILEDYGRAAFAVRHRVFLGGTVALPYALRLSPFMILSSGVPYNVTLNQDLIGSSVLNQRPSLVSTATCAPNTPPAGSIYCTPEGTFNSEPTAGDPIIPVNYLTGPSRFSLNLRLSKTFGFGPVIEGATGSPRGQGGGGGGRGGRGGGGGRPGGVFGGAGGGRAGANAANRRYNVTLSVNARNIFNNVNLATPIGTLGSPLFGQSNALAGGAFSSNLSAANRQIYLQLLFAF